MNVRVREDVLESDIEGGLLYAGPDAKDDGYLAREDRADYSPWIPGGYRSRPYDEYDRELCLLSDDVIDFIIATQPKQFEDLKKHHGEDVRTRLLRRLAREIESRGVLDVLRNGISDMGVKFRLVYFAPASGLNEDITRLYEANVFAVVRQLHYSTKNNNSIDLGLFVNGIPIFTAELKNEANGQDYTDAIAQYKRDRDPKEPLLRPGRVLAHFAVDTHEAHFTTELAGQKTDFLPFSRGKFGGKGNPPVPPTQRGYSTSYLWEEIWAKDSVLDLIGNFMQEVDVLDDKGKRTGKTKLIFPRYHQLDSVRRLVAHARDNGVGHNYLIQHSAGSGKSNSIAWLSHRLTSLHDADDDRVFDSVVVITDRRVLDKQLSETVKSFELTDGIVEHIDKGGRHLKQALEDGKQIIITTLQKFPVIAEQIVELKGNTFAVVIDEAHSSQSGESTKKLKQVLSAPTLEEAEEEDRQETDDLEDEIIKAMKARGRIPNASFFAFTATPKQKTLELFGTKNEDGTFEAFSLYSMRQAIEEGFILDVLQNYATYTAYWKLLKTAEDDPHYDHDKASYLLRNFVEMHPHAIDEKLAIMVEHFHESSAHRIGGKAKAMIVTRSRKHAVRYKLAIDRYLAGAGYPYKALVAFSGTVTDEGKECTETSMNGVPEAQTAATFHQPDYRFLIVAEKFQTGFDEPLLDTMYVDKKLAGVHAIQTLSRLNRIHPGKRETTVLDFVNEAQDIVDAFQPYYEKTLLSEATDHNLPSDIARRLSKFGVYSEADLDAFASEWFKPGREGHMDLVLKTLEPALDRFEDLDDEAQTDFRGTLKDYVSMYAFVGQLIEFTDPDLEKLYVFARALRMQLPPSVIDPILGLDRMVDMDSYLLVKKDAETKLEPGEGVIEPIDGTGPHTLKPEAKEPLSVIIDELNERFGADAIGEDGRVVMEQVYGKLADNDSLRNAVRISPREAALLAFRESLEGQLQDLVETNFDFYKRVTDDAAFGQAMATMMFELYLKQATGED